MRTRLLVLAAACLVGVVTSSCGSGSVPPNAPADAGGGGSGGGTPDGGGGSSGGTPDGGGSGGGGGPGGGSGGGGDGGSADAGSGSGEGGGGLSDAGSGSGGDGGSPDAGSGGGTDECTGVVTTLPGPGIEASSTYGTFGICLDGSSSDGSGTVLLGVQGQFDNGNDNWLGFDSGGSRVGWASSSPMIQPPPFPLESGFQWFNSGDVCSVLGRGCTRTAVLRQLSSALVETSRTTLFEYTWTPEDRPPADLTWGASKDTGRGVVVTHVHVSNAGWTLFAQRFDSSGRPTTGAVAVASGVASQQPARAVSGVSQKGPALVLWDHGSGASRAVQGRWLGTSGDPMTDVFAVATGVPAGAKLSLSRLLDGSLVLQQDGAWTLRFQPGATAGEAAPDWLVTRPNTTLSIIRGATAYLLTFPSAKCEPVHAALFAASGTRCGAMDFPAASCAHTAESGFDGTVIVSGFDEAADRCTRTYWPGLLR